MINQVHCVVKTWILKSGVKKLLKLESALNKSAEMRLLFSVAKRHAIHITIIQNLQKKELSMNNLKS